MSSLAPNKNLKWIVGTARLDPDAVFAVAGGINVRVVGTHGIPEAENVKYLRYVTGEGAKTFLQKTAAPSCFLRLYEGSGILPMEVSACGAKVVVFGLGGHAWGLR